MSSQKGRKVVSWRHRPALLRPLVLVGVLFDKFAVHNSKKLAEIVALHVPWLAGYIREEFGVQLTPNILYNRAHKMLYQNGQGPVKRSSEHYRQDPKLRTVKIEVEGKQIPFWKHLTSELQKDGIESPRTELFPRGVGTSGHVPGPRLL